MTTVENADGSRVLPTRLAPATERRWLQFRLRTLLLIPLLLGLFFAFAGQAYDHFLLLEVAYGAVLGTFWAIGRMQIVGLRNRGLRRVLPVIWAAVCGGLTSGILVGPINFVIALSRTSAGWAMVWTGGSFKTDPIEVFSAIVAGMWLGALCGAAGAALVGPLTAYIVHAGYRRNDATAGDADEPARRDSRTTDAVQRAIPSRWPRRLGRVVAGLYLLVLIGPSAWLGHRIFQYHQDQLAVNEFRQAGIRVDPTRGYHGPRWIRRVYPDEFLLTRFRRIEAVSLEGGFGAECAAPLARLRALEYLDIDAAGTEGTDAALQVLAGLTNPRLAHVSLDLSGSDVTAAGMEHLRSITALGALHADRTRMTDADLANLFGLTGLWLLSVEETPISGEGFKHLVESRLETVDLSDTETDDAGLACLARTAARGGWFLRVLELDGTEISDAGLAHLKGMSSLMRLDLGRTAVSDTGLAHLTALPLHSLRLPSTAVTDAAGADLGRMTSLLELDLSNTRITDATLSRLPALVRLHRLALDDTQVTDAGLAHLGRPPWRLHQRHPGRADQSARGPHPRTPRVDHGRRPPAPLLEIVR